MVRKIFFMIVFLWINTANAQIKTGVTYSGQKTGQPPFPVAEYTELPNPVTPDPDIWKGHQGVRVSWGSTDVRYCKEHPMPVEYDKSRIRLYAWKGERVSAQWVVSAYDGPVTLTFHVSNLVHQKDTSQKISHQNILSGFVRYVMTDELNKDGKGACGHRDNTEFDSTLVADVIDHRASSLRIPGRTTRAGWVRVWVPDYAKSGIYSGKVTIMGDGRVLEILDLEVEVNERILPEPGDWSFHLDLWQNPYAIARYYQVQTWSPAHFKVMRQDMKHYVQAGGNVITASIIHKPWNGQTYDDFETMITWMKKADGSWYFDYTIFDRWVEFMMEMGVDDQINCYSMIPWRLSFQYYDQATNQLKFLEASPGTKAFEKFWVTMLTSFANHLKKKGWFNKMYIAMDERPMNAMIETLKVIRKADENFKVSLAGNLHPELSEDVDDYCISYGQEYTPELLNMRQASGQISTYYTSCSHPYPNTFTFSPPAESEWLAWHAASSNLDGFLRWAYNSWVVEPLLDSRFITWAAGDTYLVYPGGRTSIRFERLVEGIQQYEKIRILRKQFKEKGDQESLNKIRRMLDTFHKLIPAQNSAASVIQWAKSVIRDM